jgi:hypothetical protein
MIEYRCPAGHKVRHLDVIGVSNTGLETVRGTCQECQVNMIWRRSHKPREALLLIDIIKLRKRGPCVRTKGLYD